MPLGLDLASTWSPKPSQNGAKLDPSWLQVACKQQAAKSPQNVIRIPLSAPLAPPGRDQNPLKIDSRSNKRQDAICNASWMPLEPNLERFWLPSWDQVGAKLTPTSEKKQRSTRHQNILKKRRPKKLEKEAPPF